TTTAADRQHTLQNPDRHSAARRARRVQDVGTALRTAPPLAAERHLAPGFHPAPVPGSRTARKPPQFELVLAKARVPRIKPGQPRIRPDRARADKAYASRRNHAYLRRRGIHRTIPGKAAPARNRDELGSHGGRLPRFTPGDHKTRHAVECAINRPTRHRVVATRYDKLAGRYEATVLIAAINEWL
ncbi:IS5/IS1182 family transposase, partial [Streptomyces sp. NPDC053474]